MLKFMHKLLFPLGIAAIAVFVAPSTLAAAEPPSMALSPASGTHEVGETFSVDIMLDTDGSDIAGIDIRYLNYDTALLEVMDVDAGTAGTQIAAGSLMSVTTENTVDTSAGTIAFSQITSGTNTYSNTAPAKLATVTFSVKSTGTANITFDFTSGATNDANIASGGADIINDVDNGAYTLQSSSGGSGGGSGGGGGGGGSGDSDSDSDSGSDDGGSSDDDTTSDGATGGYDPGGDTSINSDSTYSSNPTGGAYTGIVLEPVTVPLDPGMRGPQVVRLQKFLIAENYLAEGKDTGYFGSLTEAGVKSFQDAQGIVYSPVGYGVVGPKTRSAIRSVIEAKYSGGGSYYAGGSGMGDDARLALIEQLKAQLIALLEEVIRLLIERVNEMMAEQVQV